MDVNRLSQGEKIAAGSAIILLIVMSLFSWFGASGQIEALGAAVGADTSFNAWQSFDFIDLVLFVTAVVAIGAAVAKASDNRVDFPLSTIVTVLGALSTLLVLYRTIDPPADASRKIGLFLGLIVAAALTYGGWLAMQEEGSTFQDAADQLGGDRGAGSGGGDPPTAPPPPPPPPPPSSGAPPTA